ncbi:F-box protein [Parendozoicomonas haliclonae]|uniref:F-box domain-containing protein n=1 Tax=Parendozoicomonas haliclonae TaxID=1960125 RepID=A0A1X7AKT7_9GAMM|nr:hypothetical protein EHSB41UT_02514 [Parendozoicomonas haliclonae]
MESMQISTSGNNPTSLSAPETAQSRPQQAPFQGFSVETLEHIASFLPIRGLMAFSRVSRSCYQIASWHISSGRAFAKTCAGQLPVCYQPEYFSYAIKPWLQVVQSDSDEVDDLESCKALPDFPERVNLSIAKTLGRLPELRLYRIFCRKHSAYQENSYPQLSADGTHFAISDDHIFVQTELFRIAGIHPPVHVKDLNLAPILGKSYFSEDSCFFVAETIEQGVFISRRDQQGRWSAYKRPNPKKVANARESAINPITPVKASSITKVLSPEGCPGYIREVFSPDWLHVVTVNRACMEMFSQMESKKWARSSPLISVLHEESPPTPIQVTFSPDSYHCVFKPGLGPPAQLLTTKCALVYTFNRHSCFWHQTGVIRCDKTIRHISFSPNSVLLGVAANDKTLRIYGRTCYGIWMQKGIYRFCHAVDHVSFTKDNFHVIVTTGSIMHYLTIGKMGNNRAEQQLGRAKHKQKTEQTLRLQPPSKRYHLRVPAA